MKWPESPHLHASSESQSEAKVTREMLAAAVAEPERDDHVNLLEKHTLTKTLRIGAWVKRCIYNCKNERDNRIGGPLRYDEILKEEKWWIAKVQKLIPEEEREKRKDLNLQTNEDGLLECRSGIEGHYPLYLPNAALFSTKLVEREHSATFHGGISLTMTRKRQRYWIPKLRRLVKRVRSNCWGCKRSQSKP